MDNPECEWKIHAARAELSTVAEKALAARVRGLRASVRPPLGVRLLLESRDPAFGDLSDAELGVELAENARVAGAGAVNEQVLGGQVQ